MAKDMATVKYVDDAGNNWCILADKTTIEVAGQAAKLGATVTGGGCPPIPGWLKPRYVLARGGTSDAIRKFICYTAASAAFTTPGTTLTVQTFRGSGVATETFTTLAVGYGERKRRRNQDDPTIT